MRFLMLNWRDPRNPQAGGAERVTEGYLAALAERGHTVYWYAPRFLGAPETDRVSGITIVRGGRVGTSIVAARQWYRRQAPFDLVIDQHHGIPWYAPWWCGVPCVAYIHEVLGPIWDTFYPKPISTFGRWQERRTHWAYRQVPFWTACQATKEFLEQCGVRQVTLIPYGVHTVALPALDPKPLTPPLDLAVVSRLAPNKRIDHAIRVLPFLSARGIAAKLTIIGTGERETALRQLAGELGLTERVEFTGSLAEPAKDDRLRRAHFLIHTSVREGWGLNVIEANAMGTPTVVYPVAGLCESTLQGETGEVALAETPEALGEALQAVVQTPDRYERYRQNAWQRAKTFHWSQVLPRACDWLEARARRTKV